MTLYKGQNSFEVELMPGEKRETLFTEQIRKSAYKAMNAAAADDADEDADKLNPDLLISLVKMEKAGSVQASNLIGMLMSKKLVSVDLLDLINTAHTTRGNAGPGFSGELSLGPYVYGKSKDDTNNEDTFDILREEGNE